MKQFKYLMLMLLAVLAFASCDELTGDKEPEFSDYFDMRVTSCERVGSKLRIDFTLKNISGKDLQNVELKTVKADDDLGNHYSSADVAVNGGFTNYYKTVAIKKKETITGSFIVPDYDKTNFSKRVNVTFLANASELDFSGEVALNKLSVTDNRILSYGFQTNDNGLQFDDVSCVFKKENNANFCYFTFKVKNVSSVDIADITFNSWQFKDNQGNSYNHTAYSLNGSDNYNYYVTLPLKAGQSATITCKVEGFYASASVLSGEMTCRSDSYPLTDDKVRFFDINVIK